MGSMSVATDTFTAFVDVLADALDNHHATAEDLAARVHLSRFHFDRVIAATAGEPPAAFRRRILLEQAAYRLATSDRTVLDIAVEAGYRSNEAFTRAFARTYGPTPRRGDADRPRPRSRRRAVCTSIHPAACGCPHERRWDRWTS
jgi:AraC family transcriptional regulator